MSILLMNYFIDVQNSPSVCFLVFVLLTAFYTAFYLLLLNIYIKSATLELPVGIKYTVSLQQS